MANTESPRRRAIREGRLFSHPIPCNLVKDERGVWVESPWFVRK